MRDYETLWTSLKRWLEDQPQFQDISPFVVLEYMDTMELEQGE